MKILALLLTFVLAFPAWAEELEHFPGWKINKIEKAESEDGSYSSAPDYYGLTPPDERPPVSIDARTAKLLKVGEAQAEEVYNRTAPKKAEAKGESSDDQYVYSSGNSGYVQANEISSTLPGYVPEPVVAREPPKRGGESFGAVAVASYGGAAASAAGSSASYGDTSYGGPSAGGSDSSYGAGSSGSPMSGALKSAAAAASPAAAQAEAKAKARQVAANDASNSTSGGVKVKSGFDAIDSSGTGTSGKPGKTSSAGRDPASDEEDAPPPPCQKGRFVYDKPTHIRVKLPIGCGLIHISAWGAGGGSGLQSYHSGGRDGGMDTVREIPGSGASFMSTSWEIDARKYDLVVVVGYPGDKATQKTTTVKDTSGDSPNGTRTVTTFVGGEGGFPEGKKGGTGGGGGGGFSGVFLAPKTDNTKNLSQPKALNVANGGSGGGSGGAGASMNVGSGGSDARMTNQIGEKGKGNKAGFHYYPERGGAGSPGNSGKVILEYF